MRYQYMFEKEMKLSCHGWENCPVTVDVWWWKRGLATMA